MRIGAVITDLMLYSRIESAATAAGATLLRGDSPADLPDNLDLLLVDWSGRRPDWAADLAAQRDAGTRVVLFGRHTEIESHRAAKEASLGPMWARSRLVIALPAIMRARVERAQ